MHKHLFALTLFFVATFATAFGQDDYKSTVLKERQEKLAHLIDKETSPFKSKKDRKRMKALHHFDVSEDFIIEAKYKPLGGKDTVTVETSAQTQKQFIRYAELHFEMEDKYFAITAFQSVRAAKKPDYDGSLFLMFTDNTTGNSTYGGGRYIDIPKPTGETVKLDFNRAYNPYCAYGGGFYCPIPPATNFIKAEITAGEKNYDATH